MSEMVERVATAIANRRAGRRGAPPVLNVLVLLKSIHGGKLYDEVMDDARTAIEAMREPTVAMQDAGIPGAINLPIRTWHKMIDAALKE